MSTPAEIAQGGRMVGRVAFIAALLTVGLIAYGAWVRVSGSGLGCPDWPNCDGLAVTELDRAALIESGHRVYAGITMLAVALGAILAIRRRKADPAAAWLMTGTLAAILVQAVLGWITVLTELHGMVRLVHLSMAMGILTLLTVVAVRGLKLRPRAVPSLTTATTLLLTGAALVLLGGAIVGAGVSAGCLGFPLCGDGSSAGAETVHILHRLAGGLLIVAVFAAAMRMRGSNRDRRVISLMHGITFVLILQGVVGLLVLEAFNGRFSQHETVRVAHLGLAALSWWGLAWLWALAWEVRRA